MTRYHELEQEHALRLEQNLALRGHNLLTAEPDNGNLFGSHSILQSWSILVKVTEMIQSTYRPYCSHILLGYKYWGGGGWTRETLIFSLNLIFKLAPISYYTFSAMNWELWSGSLPLLSLIRLFTF